MPRDEIVQEIIQRPREAFVPLPDLRVIERPGWRQIITPSLKTGGLNEVSFARLDERDLERVVDETIAQYRAAGCRFVWRVGPDSTPALGPVLASRGGKHAVSHGMARATAMAAAPDPRVTVERVDAHNVDAYTRVSAEGWDMDPGPLVAVHARVLAHRTQQMFLARLDGEPAATAASAVFPRSVYLMGGVTLARFRGHGLYRALVVARMAAAGVPLATSHARAETSAPILERLGFETLCTYDNYNF